MRKPILPILILFALVQLGQAQRFSPHLELNMGMGVLPTFFKDNGKAKVLPVCIGADYRLSSQLSLGLQAGYSVTASGLQQFNDGSTGQWNNHFRLISLRLAAHSRPLNDAWHIYGGISLGYASSRIAMVEGEIQKARKELGVGQRNDSLLYTGFLGTRGRISPRLSCFGEIGYGISLAVVGLSFRL